MFVFLVPCSFFRWKVTNSPGFIHLSRLPSPASLAKRSLLPRPPPVWHALPRGLGGARRRAWCGCGWDSFQVMPETGPQTTRMVEDVKEAAKVAKPEGLFGVSWMGVFFCSKSNEVEPKWHDRTPQVGMHSTAGCPRETSHKNYKQHLGRESLPSQNSVSCQWSSDQKTHADFISSQFVNRFVFSITVACPLRPFGQGSKVGPLVHYTLNGRGASTGTPGRRGCQ